MTDAITSFTREHEWLSNFWTGHVLIYSERRWKSAEHAYQAMKCRTFPEQERIRLEAPKPIDAKRMGNRVILRPNWDARKIGYMKAILNHKFADKSELARWLIATGDAHLEEGNRHGDLFWGTVDGKGENHLGILLMQRRAVLRGEVTARIGE